MNLLESIDSSKFQNMNLLESIDSSTFQNLYSQEFYYSLSVYQQTFECHISPPTNQYLHKNFIFSEYSFITKSCSRESSVSWFMNYKTV